jgi:5-methyltetrahydrofolate--homocysteine methyltransferase
MAQARSHETELFDRLKRLILELDREGVEQTTRAALDAGVAPQEIIAQGLAPGMEAVGERYQEGEFFVPELMLSARAMHAALEILRPRLAAAGGASPGTVVLGTVQGDVHEIGKNIVGAVLAGDGFEVHDLGEDVAPQVFLARAQETGASVIGLSALISLAVSKMAETVSLLREGGFGGRVIVGGAAVTRQTAEQIGADAHAADAWEALRRVRDLAKPGARASAEEARA